MALVAQEDASRFDWDHSLYDVTVEELGPALANDDETTDLAGVEVSDRMEV